jgi:hypothetical protein
MYGISKVGNDGGFIIEGKEGMDLMRLLSLEGRLKMEKAGLRFSPSGRTLARELYGIRGSRDSVLAQVIALREKRYPKPPAEDDQCDSVSIPHMPEVGESVPVSRCVLRKGHEERDGTEHSTERPE